MKNAADSRTRKSVKQIDSAFSTAVAVAGEFSFHFPRTTHDTLRRITKQIEAKSEARQNLLVGVAADVPDVKAELKREAEAAKLGGKIRGLKVHYTKIANRALEQHGKSRAPEASSAKPRETAGPTQSLTL